VLILAETEWNFGDFLLASLVVFLWVNIILMFLSVFADLFRRHDISGWAKAGWILVIFFLPFLGVLIYVVARPPIGPTGERVSAP
jgi:ABC-type uncharacterized transport system permease subunit